MQLLIVVLLLVLSLVQCYKLLPSSSPLIAKNINKINNNNNIINRNTKLYMDIPLIPTALVTVGITFAIFNLDNPVDLTDQGIAKAKLQRRKERVEKGEIIQPNQNLDPYRWKIFEEDDDDNDLEILASGGKKKKTGGCG
jgi:hypothetical protein